ncbi:MAG: maltose alpha-D-glucosyltransferase [Cyclobacteriaceae bacterium]
MSDLPKNTDPLWFKDAILYELHIRAFFDSNGDGIGDFEGLVQKLNYLEDLGINTIWLLPFYPSPLRDDGYDVTDYYDVHSDYGTLTDFKVFLKEAHRRGIRVITELILNHTSDQHAWFKKARKSKPGSRYRDFYVWSDAPDKYKDATVVFADEEPSNWTYDEEAKAYYWHRYYRHQPDLNFENAEVQLEMIKVADFWLKMGVDGFRLPSITYLFEEEGTSCENLPQTHAFLKKLRAHIDKHYKNRILIAEANLWPEDAATYFGNGDECHMNFHYPLMPRLFLALRTEDTYPIVDIMDQTPATLPSSQWALFLRNHDEMGLEMVTEEEKDYLFKAYATDPNTKFNLGIRRRLAPLLNNDRRKIELLHTILFSLPGAPVLYYGDEIGMGDNVYLGDRSGVRTPMQWNPNVNAGFSQANPQRLYLPVINDPVYRHESVNVAAGEENSSSLLWWMKHVIIMRKRLNIFGRGDIRFIEGSNAKVLAFARTYENQCIIVVSNLSQFSQAASLNFSQFRDCEITDVFSQNRFMSVGEGAYPITIGPYGYFWFQADKAEKKLQAEPSGELALLKTDISWERMFDNYNEVRTLERRILPPFMKKCRWFGGKAKVISKVGINKVIPLKVEGDTHFLVIIEVHYVQRLPELYFLPLTFVSPDSLTERVEYAVQSVVCRGEIQNEAGFIMDSTYDRVFRDFLFLNMEKSARLKDDDGGVLEFNSSVFAKLDSRKIDSKVLKADQSNTAIIYNDKYFFKFYRKLEKEINPDLEIIRFLTENTSFQNSPKYAGSVEYRDSEGKRIVFGLLQEKVENQGDAWGMTMDSVAGYFERVLTKSVKLPALIENPVITFDDTPKIMQEFIGREFHDRVVLLAQRTAEMHIALATEVSNNAFIPERFTPNYQRSLYSSLRKLLKDRFGLLESSLPKLDPQTRELANSVLEMEGKILESFSEIYKTKITAVKTRIHGDFHLGQVLFTGKDFIIIDFEGEPAFSFSERRLKKNPLKDVAGMMRSFDYAAFGKILLNENYRDANLGIIEQAAEQWQHYVSRYYLGAYLETTGMGPNLSGESNILIRTFLLEKAIYELGYELNGRPDWVKIPLRGIHYLVNRYRLEKSRNG